MYNLGQMGPHFAQFRAYSSLWRVSSVFCVTSPDQGRQLLGRPRVDWDLELLRVCLGLGPIRSGCVAA